MQGRRNEPRSRARRLGGSQIRGIAYAARSDQHSVAGALAHGVQRSEIRPTAGAHAIERHHDHAARPTVAALPAAGRVHRLATALVE